MLRLSSLFLNNQFDGLGFDVAWIACERGLRCDFRGFDIAGCDGTFSQIRQGPFQELKLLIIGDQISKLPALRRAVHQLKLHKHVRFLGYIPDETLAVLYRSAEVFVFPSLYEGFGLPPLEAMASGTPVVTSNTSSLPEVTGGAAVLVDPYDVGSIVDGVRRVLTDPSLAAELRRKGPLRAREFSWARSAAKTKALYELVAARHA